MTGTSASVVVRISKDVAIAGWVQIQSRSGDLQTRRASAAVALWAMRGTCHPERSERISEHFWSSTASKWSEMFRCAQHDRTRDDDLVGDHRHEIGRASCRERV